MGFFDNGFLNAFDNPAFLSSLLGAGGDISASPTGTIGAAGGNAAPPSGVVGAAGGNASGFQPLPTGPMPPMQGLDPGASAAQPGIPPMQGFGSDMPLGNGQPTAPYVPLPQPRPQMPPAPSNNVQSIGPGPTGPPMSLAPPMPPASQFNPATAPPTSNTGGGLMAALGISPNSMRPMMAGLGQGLSAVGQMRPGTPGAQAFAAGAGGALTGGEKALNLQEAQQRQKQNDLFNQSSAAFKDMLASKNSDNVETYRQAQAKYLLARAQSMMTGGAGSNAWQNTPYGKVMGIETKAQAYEKAQQIVLQKQWQLNGASPDQQKQDLAALQQKVDKYRANLYTTAGVDPKQAQKLKDMGTTADNPFDVKGMTLEQFHSQVPMGAWYKDQNGVVRQRTVAPPGVSVNAPARPGQPSPYDDMTAMTPAA